jgi:hypothetical protein
MLLVDRERVVVASRGDLVGSGSDRGGHVFGYLPELGVGTGGCGFDRAERGDEGRIDRHSGQRKVLNRPLGLCAPQRIFRNPYVAHRVVLDPEVLIRHCLIVPQRAMA